MQIIETKKYVSEQRPLSSSKNNTEPLQTNEDEDSNSDQLNDSEREGRNTTKNATKRKIASQKPLICNVSDTKYRIVRHVAKKLMKFKLQKTADGTNWDVMWTDNAVQPEQLSRMQQHQKINHFPGMYSLSRKNYLGRNLMKMRKKFPDDYRFFPLTWMLPSDSVDLRNYCEKDKKPKTFIVKPEASCQGRGIFLVKSYDDIPQGEHFVVQKYLSKPFLIDGLKFDFRIYVLLTGCSPLRIYIYDQGLARFATEKYVGPSRNNMDQPCMHLTNYAINKNSQNFVYNQSETEMDTGHKRSLTSVMKMLREQGHDVDKLYAEIYDMLIKTFVSAQPVLAHHYKSCQPENLANNMCFELLGFDVILDEKFKPFLLEVNYTPSFSTDTPLDTLIKKNVIRDSLQLVNITQKAKNEVITALKAHLMNRMYSGKKHKLTPEEKIEQSRLAQIKRDEWEDAHLGAFKKIYPLRGVTEKYDQFLTYADTCYQQLTGANIRRNVKKQKQATNIQTKKETANQQLQKIYKQKLPVPKSLIKSSNISVAKVAAQQQPPSVATTNTLDNIRSSSNFEIDLPSKAEIYSQEPAIQSAKNLSSTSKTYYGQKQRIHRFPSSQKSILSPPAGNPAGIFVKMRDKQLNSTKYTAISSSKQNGGKYVRPKLFELSGNFNSKRQ